VLIAGDAFETANMDSWSGALTKNVKLWRGGTPFTCDWNKAFDSVQRLAELKPEVLAAGHGRPVSGAGTSDLFERFARDFSIPAHGRYVDLPAEVNERGVVSLPPRPADPVKIGVVVFGLGCACLAAYRANERRNRRRIPFRGVDRSYDTFDRFGGDESRQRPEYSARTIRGGEISVPPT
jgi:hypothetical protein